ncbi:transposase, partial [Henriciella mobilis]|uniref:transposase n=1 Tax=Henriciella mobilis TaxID=2305467 RepID=UPI001F23F283
RPEAFSSRLSRNSHPDCRAAFYDLREAKVLIETWRRHYNTARPHSSLGYRPPAPQTILPAAFIPPYCDEVAA